MSRAVPAVPDKALPLPPHVQTAVEALAQDGSEYARLYNVPLDQAMRELQAQQDSVAATDALQQEFRDRLAGISIAHDGGFRIIVLLTGKGTELFEQSAPQLERAVALRTNAPEVPENERVIPMIMLGVPVVGSPLLVVGRPARGKER